MCFRYHRVFPTKYLSLSLPSSPSLLSLSLARSLSLFLSLSFSPFLHIYGCFCTCFSKLRAKSITLVKRAINYIWMNAIKMKQTLNSDLLIHLLFSRGVIFSHTISEPFISYRSSSFAIAKVVVPFLYCFPTIATAIVPALLRS